MKKIFVVISLCAMILFYACSNTNEPATKEWISQAQKPIVCKKVGDYWDGALEWTLIDANGEVYFTGRIRAILPDTIKSLSTTNKK